MNFIKKALVFIPIFVLTCPNAALPWGSISLLAETHQYILKQAYALLEKDKAYMKDLFPSLEEILRFEGVNALLTGPGPDGEGNSQFSQHYYNPRLEGKGFTTQGKAPETIGDLIAGLADGKSKKEARAKSAAWAAHFLADLFCPYHVNGQYYYYINKLRDSLEPEITGPRNLLSYLVPNLPHGNDFKREISLFLRDNEDGRARDWFDPWYYDGDYDIVPRYFDDEEKEPLLLKVLSPTTLGSSHVKWEFLAKSTGYNLPGYSPEWRQPNPEVWEFPPNAASLAGIYDGVGDLAQDFAIESARLTLDNLEQILRNPGDGINFAIQAVYTMWRSTISGLRFEKPSVILLYPGDASGNTRNSYKVETHVRNQANSKVSGVRIRARVIDGYIHRGNERVLELIQPSELQKEPIVLGSEESASFEWFIEPTGPGCEVTYEVIGSYETPDLQFASTTQKLDPLVDLNVLVVAPDQDNASIPGAQVKISGHPLVAYLPEQTTNRQGLVLYPGIPPGTYKISVTASGYSDAEVTKRIEGTTPEEGLIIAMRKKTTTVLVTVRDEDAQAPVSGAAVTCKTLTPDQRITSAGGMVAFPKVDFGNWKFSIDAAGYASTEFTLAVDPIKSQEITHTVYLKRIEKTQPGTEPRAPKSETDTRSPQALCDCVTRWQKLVLDPKLKKELIGFSDIIGHEVRITKPWTYDPKQKLCVGSYEYWSSKTWYDPNNKWQCSGRYNDMTVNLEQALGRCKELEKLEKK